MKHVNIIILSILILPIIVLSGCISGDETYYTAKEQYSMGWILHNINDSTSTDISYSLSDLAIYNYSYDYPADAPYTFLNFFAYTSPVPRNVTSFSIVLGNSLAVPLNRTYFVKGTSSSAENYQTNWSFFNEMEIDYSNLEYYQTHFEEYNSTDVYNSITPVAGTNINIGFGKAPYTPASFSVSNQSISLTDYMIKGYIPRAYLWRDTYGSIGIPQYQIYSNNNLLYSGYVIDPYGTWNESFFNYSFPSSGTYLANLTIPSDYPVWSTANIESTFSIPSGDVQPPILNHIDAKPYFEYNKTYDIGMNLTDNVGIKNVSAYYMENSVWIPLEVYNDSGIFETNLTISDPSFKMFDLKISVNDTSDNQINYTISPLALVGENVSLTLNFNSPEVFQGGQLSVKGEAKANGNDVSGLMIELSYNNTIAGSAMTNDLGYSTNIKLPCNISSNLNVSAKFSGTGTLMSNETFNYATMNVTALNFSVDGTVPVHYTALVNANGYGAYITINRSSWSYNAPMEDSYFYFYPHHYGNYTVTLKSGCGENMSKNVFSNITTTPSVYQVLNYPFFPTPNDDVYLYFTTYSQDGHNLVGNISNSSISNALNLTFSSYPEEDYYTGELYNYSYCYDCWMAHLSNLSAGIYNLSLEVSDVINQKNDSNATLYIYPTANITFNITDFNGNPVNRILTVGFDYYDMYEYSIYGSKQLEMLPNVSYFNKTFDVGIANLTYSDVQYVKFENSTMLGNMNAYSDYLENKTDLPDKIIYSTYFYNASWNYSGVYLYFAYSNVSRFGMHNASRSNLYSCKSYDFLQHRCAVDWTNVTTDIYKYGNYVYVYGYADDPEATAFGEPQMCGDGYCSPYENCSSCPIDCGQCTSPPSQPNQQQSNNNNNNQGGSNNLVYKTVCNESWSCTDWSDCVNSVQTRKCSDANFCGTSKNKPPESQNCTVKTFQTQQNNQVAASCDFECCINETEYVEKPCDSGSDCVNHTCVNNNGNFNLDNVSLLYVAVGIVAVFAVAFVVVYLKVLKKKIALSSKQQSPYDTINNLRNKITEIKYSSDVPVIENELNLAKYALDKGLKETAAMHIENAKKLENSLKS